MRNHICIWLGTFKRPKMLDNTLKSFCEVEIPEGYDVSLIILDNDETGSAKETVDRNISNIPFTTHYEINPVRGTVSQRNTFIDKTLNGSYSHAVMVDDDETAEKQWLVRMVDTLNQYDADVVDGAVERVLPEDTPKWMIKGKFFEWHSFKTGSIRRAASGANCLFKVKLIKEMGLRFNTAFNLSGGSDTFFFTEATNKGAKIVWLDERLVNEYFPKSRTTKKWILMRAFRRTSSKFNRKRLEMGYSRAAVTYFFNGVFQLFSGIVLTVISIPFGPIPRIHSLRIFYKGLGTFNGILGREYQEYKKTHGE